MRQILWDLLNPFRGSVASIYTGNYNFSHCRLFLNEKIRKNRRFPADKSVTKTKYDESYDILHVFLILNKVIRIFRYIFLPESFCRIAGAFHWIRQRIIIFVGSTFKIME